MSDPHGARGWLLKLAIDNERKFSYARQNTSAIPKLMGGPEKSTAYISGISAFPALNPRQ